MINSGLGGGGISTDDAIDDLFSRFYIMQKKIDFSYCHGSVHKPDCDYQSCFHKFLCL